MVDNEVLLSSITIVPVNGYWDMADQFAQERINADKAEKNAAAENIDEANDGPFIVAVETNLMVTASYVEFADAESSFNTINIHEGDYSTTRSALYDGQMNRVRTASMTFDEDQWELCD